MKYLTLLSLLLSSSLWAQVNPTHPTLVCSGNTKFGEYSVIFTGPAWGSHGKSLGYNDYSFKIISQKSTDKDLTYVLKDLDNYSAKFSIDLTSGKAKLTYDMDEVKNFLCKSSTSTDENLELEDFLKLNKLPYLVCPESYNSQADCKLINAL
jgi:hypothetical protein